MFKRSFYNDNVGFLQLLQYSSMYPSWHPPGHLPLTWLQGSLFLQWLLQRSLQSSPKYLGLHSKCNKSTHYGAYSSLLSLTMHCFRRDIITTCLCIYEYTCAAVSVCVSRITSPVTLTRQFVTGKFITTVTTTVRVTVITIGPVITFCNRLWSY